MKDFIEKYRQIISSASPDSIRLDPSLDEQLTLNSLDSIKVVYAPFDYINTHAKVVLVGITPGKQQAVNALLEARKQILSGAPTDVVVQAAKETASFSGSMRSSLTSMLDAVGLARWLKIETCSSLFTTNSKLVHFTSALRYPVYVDGQNYSGQPEMTKHPLLQQYLENYLATEIEHLPDAVWVPLGPKPTAALNWLASRNRIDRTKILDGLPHPSGANAERIAYFLGRKPREMLSIKTNPSTLDEAKAILLEKISFLPN